MKKTVSEEKLRKLIREALKKSNLREVVAPNVFESECILTVPVAENVTDILTKMRAIESVTIVNIMPGGGRRIGGQLEALDLKIKFVKGAYSVRQRLSIILSKFKRIQGIVGFSVQRTRKLEEY
jgi:hydroxymethylpyrimidine/phosphomethylpyrimidine kinase